MIADFASIIADLWRGSGRPPPSVADGLVELRAGDISLRLEEEIDGESLIASVDVGPLPRDPLRRATQIRRILAANLDSLATRRCGLHLRDGDPPGLVISGRHSFHGDRHALAELIDDILVLRQLHEDVGMAPQTSELVPIGGERDDRSFIFRP